MALLRHLNVLFPVEFRAIEQPFLHARGDTTVVKATHKVSLTACFAGNLFECMPSICTVENGFVLLIL